MRLAINVIAAVLLLQGCATTMQQPVGWDGPADVVQVDGVPILEQTTADTCGAVSTAMVMRWAGLSLSEDKLHHEMVTPGKNGTLQADMIGVGRRNGLTVLEVKGADAVVAELAAGHPVIVLQNLRYSWWPQWHYVVVVGFAPTEQQWTVYTGAREPQLLDAAKFQNLWNDSDSWGLVMLPAGELSASADEGEHVAAAMALERLQLNVAARAAYEAILAKWPRSLGALVGSANAAYAMGDLTTATARLQIAAREYPDNQGVRHNLAHVLSLEHE